MKDKFISIFAELERTAREAKEKIEQVDMDDPRSVAELVLIILDYQKETSEIHERIQNESI